MGSNKRENELWMTEDGTIVSSYQGEFQTDDDLTKSEPPRNKFTHPYSYDPFTVWGRKHPGANGTVYSDRLRSEDFNSLAKEYFPRGVPWEQGEAVEALLRKYTGDDELEVTRVIEYCNSSSGNPLWRIDFINGKSGKNKRI